ncbi:hypothetical protein LEP1GSC191_4209 [Leptospira borgpetersenii serovar Mini str. 201000851]|uniref:Uncharacterized protein n=1 Tax=Leptospira borgpetersenii str. 200801926 TaxID=1193009 RepID=A0ABP2S0B6_LEPBO|nr:hypothetical protein LEP1GSC128_0999 [Leptospira borgpetersenii str. 200801926]ENO63052.1 hypothetical protein LEP1GSC191_4209 [Leptospira borgpetersenii serovar Mini str. 201000851]
MNGTYSEHIAFQIALVRNISGTCSRYIWNLKTKREWKNAFN